MSGNRPGGQHKLVIKKKTLQYPADPSNPGNVKIEKESDVDAQTPLPAQALQLKLGLRIKQTQTVELFEVRFKPGPNGLLPLHVQPADDPIAQDLTATLGKASDERWATFLADYDPQFGAKFKTKLASVRSRRIPHGFQLVTVAFTHENPRSPRQLRVGIRPAPREEQRGHQLNLGGGGGAAAPAKKTARRSRQRPISRRARATNGRPEAPDRALRSGPRRPGQRRPAELVRPDRRAGGAPAVRSPGGGPPAPAAECRGLPVALDAPRSARCRARRAAPRLVGAPDPGVQGPAGRRERDHRERHRRRAGAVRVQPVPLRYPRHARSGPGPIGPTQAGSRSPDRNAIPSPRHRSSGADVHRYEPVEKKRPKPAAPAEPARVLRRVRDALARGRGRRPGGASTSWPGTSGSAPSSRGAAGEC